MLAEFSYARFRTRTVTVNEDVKKLKQHQPLLDYLRQQNWDASPAARGSSEFVGLCPLHQELGLRSTSRLARISSTATVVARVAI